MSANTNSPENQEIDLSIISKKIGGFFDHIGTSVFGFFLFLKRNFIALLLLFIIGGAIGYYLDKTSKTYENHIILTPNFGAVDYLYTQIELINSKINEGDTLFLKNVVGIQSPKKLDYIEIKPLNDVYKFIENKPENFELIKLMAEDGNITKILEDNTTSKNYPYHVITFLTHKNTTDAQIAVPLLTYLNNTEYFKKIQKLRLENVREKIIENDSIIAQIDGFLNSFKNRSGSTPTSDKLIYYNENTQLNDVIKTKDELINEQGMHKLELITLDEIIKKISITTNIKKVNALTGKMKFIVPFIFFLLFILAASSMTFYRKQTARMNA